MDIFPPFSIFKLHQATDNQGIYNRTDITGNGHGNEHGNGHGNGHCDENGNGNRKRKVEKGWQRGMSLD